MRGEAFEPGLIPDLSLKHASSILGLATFFIIILQIYGLMSIQSFDSLPNMKQDLTVSSSLLLCRDIDAMTPQCGGMNMNHSSDLHCITLAISIKQIEEL